ncbi:hypothetical protein FB639_001397 [Coemansia asiatica]|nr:hypothetical protein FB639_001397 [Coemansia asiatica]
MTKHIRKQKSLSNANNNNNNNNNNNSIRNTSNMVGFSAYGLYGSINPADPPAANGSSGGQQRDPVGGTNNTGIVRSMSQHGRSVSLLGRLKHAGSGSLQSPTASPTSSEGSSSRDTRSERTLAHSASSGSIRIFSQQQQQQQQQPGQINNLLSSQDSSSGVKDGAKKRSGGRKSGSGFIAQLLRGKAGPRVELASAEQQATGVGRFVRSPGTPGSQGSVDSDSSGSPAAESMGSADQRYCAQQAESPDSVYSAYYSGEPAQDAGAVDMEQCSVEHPVGNHPVANHPVDYQQQAGGYAPQWDNHLGSALPVYQPIDMARVANGIHGQPSSGGYVRATRPALPDARMLAPMASLAEVFRSPDPNEFHALSNRELRFAVENHMLVDQHRYLIRDLGHARSAIAALKQVVQAKEERLEHYEAANMELQQRVALLESVLSSEQRQQMTCLPYALSVFQSSASSASSVGVKHEDLEKSDSATQDISDNGFSVDSRRTTEPRDASVEQRRVDRPLSGYATGYSFNDKPVHQLPRVFSGEYSAADVQAMEASVGVLASAIKSMPRDEHSVADIIATKRAEEETGSENDRCNSKRVSGSAAGSLSSPVDQKRRSRFFSALRLSGFGSQSQSQPQSQAVAAASDSENDETNSDGRRQGRRSVSLGSSNNNNNKHLESGADSVCKPQSTVAIPKRINSEPTESLAFSCPLLASSGFTDSRARDARQQQQQRQQQKQRSARRQLSSDSIGSSAATSSCSSGMGRYPAGLGLGDASSSTEGSARVASNNSGGGMSRRSRIANRLSFTPQPRRSTSAPSRPQSMQVARRRSWLSRLFDSSSSDGNCVPADTNTAGENEDDEEEGKAAGRAQRRRVMTQSSAEVSRYLNRLGLEDASLGQQMRGGGGGGGGGNAAGVLGRSGVLEDVIDVSGEDEERASRPSLTVAEIRQQTLDALNGTLKVPRDADAGVRVSSMPQQRPAGNTIRRLSTQSNTSSTSDTSLGLGLGVRAGRRGSSGGDHEAGTASPPNVASSPNISSDVADAGDSAGRRWAPAFWAPPPLPFHAAPASASSSSAGSPDASNIWASEDNSSSIGSRPSDDGRYRSPQGSISASSRSTNSNAANSGGSPWELVKVPLETRPFPLSPSSRTPPTHGLGFFEEPPVPDSDELTMAARRSLSLRMSRNAFLQAEPLPESDDSTDVVPLAALGEHIPSGLKSKASGGGGGAGRNEDGVRRTKRKSLLWQLGASRSMVPPPSASLSVAVDGYCAGSFSLTAKPPSAVILTKDVAGNASLSAASAGTESASVASLGHAAAAAAAAATGEDCHHSSYCYYYYYYYYNS